MHRRDLIKALTSGLMVLTAGSGKVLANNQAQQERAIELIAAKYGKDEEYLQIINEAVASWSTLDEHYYHPKVYDSKIRKAIVF